MIKNPVKGKVKTRLTKDIGEEQALFVYNKLLQHTCKVASEIQVDRFVFYSDIIDRKDQFINDGFKKYVQCDGDLGVRMEYAFSIPFKNEYHKVVMIGADCYDLTSLQIQNAFDALDNNDFVIGPAKDGGYYLIGMKKWNRWIFRDKPWSTEKLLAETRNAIQENNGKLFLLDPLTDIDTITELNNYPELTKPTS
ncbi:MAG: TIGR04282 family arsenosugar biosynthesis glycosyltransferase [Chitinophagales bacterium]|nr:TIGR04282 family arsenosugar biosynthesis glycosyltransferase [Bacteroidota bacterium]MBP7398783.1 TIGR04282 family arsenosugar biosynthesis glycosyltransferase [Chitinophagales bacterium]MBK8489167.1 TIGR04282 family arsenosugar biosynthesis glycosyltransferase [Bacteroidota bacterium]MBP8753513.1 TIGR04282 family arsenosugar biosynthesis glycosyltransferase [Chitinophagales bacterium]MBP9188343.1 TIGR04282 family arsenosugar biosynthesis glycosyltransferase [Chitinophagales bacterium]